MSVGKGSTSQSGSGTQNTSQTGTITPNAYPGISSLLDTMASGATTLANTQTPYFPGQGYVSPSAPTTEGINMGMSSLPYYQSGAQGLSDASATQNQAAASLYGAADSQQGIANTAANNYGVLSNAADVANNPYVQSQLAANKQQVMQNWYESVLPSINNGAAAVNALGSTRQGVAQAQGAERTAQQLANANASTMNTAYGQGLSAQQNALSQLGNVQQGFATPGQTQYAAGQMQENAANLQGQAGDMLNTGAQQALGYGQNVEGYQQQALQDAQDRYNYQYSEPWQRASNTSSLIGNLFNPYIGSTSTQSGTTSGTTNQSGSSSTAGMRLK